MPESDIRFMDFTKEFSFYLAEGESAEQLQAVVERHRKAGMSAAELRERLASLKTGQNEERSRVVDAVMGKVQ